MASDDSGWGRLREFSERAKRLRGELRSLDLDSLVREGVLTPIGGGWYEVPGKIRDLPESLGLLATELGNTETGRPKIKLGAREPVLKALDQF